MQAHTLGAATMECHAFKGQHRMLPDMLLKHSVA